MFARMKRTWPISIVALLTLVSQPAQTAVPAPGTTTVTVDFVVPSQVSPSELAVAGSEVFINAGAQIVTPLGNFSDIASLGLTPLKIERDVEIGSVLSVGSVRPADGVHIHGSVRTSDTLLAPPSAQYVVDDGVFEHQNIPTQHLIRRASFTVLHRTIAVPPKQTQPMVVAPGYYDKLSVPPSGEVVLNAGSYYFGTLDIGPGAKLTIDDSKGTVFVYVGDHFVYAGQIVRKGGGYPRWLISYLGSNSIILAKPFLGTLIAPNALVQLNANNEQYEGTFYGQKVDIHPGVKIVHREFPWVIQSVSFDRNSLCNGETVHIRVAAEDPTNLGTQAKVAIDGTPTADMYDQIESAPGKHVYAVSAVGADGTQDSLLSSIDVIPCPSTLLPLPTLVANVNVFHPDVVDFTVLNAAVFDDGTATYEWDFGDGGTFSGGLAAVSHDYSDSVPSGVQYKAFDVRVSVRRPGLADASAIRTFVIWSAYEMSRARGALEPPTEPVDPVLKENSGDFIGHIVFMNRETEPLSYERRRIDQIPCDGDAAITYGGEEASATQRTLTARITDRGFCASSYVSICLFLCYQSF